MSELKNQSGRGPLASAAASGKQPAVPPPHVSFGAGVGMSTASGNAAADRHLRLWRSTDRAPLADTAAPAVHRRGDVASTPLSSAAQSSPGARHLQLTA